MDPNTTGTSGSAFAQLITNLANNASSVVIDGATAGTNPMPFAGLMGYGSDNSTGPKAYLNVLVFDQNYQLLTSSFVPVTTAARETGSNVPHQYLKSPQITIQQPGYVYIYFSNENPTPVEVFFDDFKVTHTNSPIIQKDDYYPFGMTFNSYSAPSGVGQKFKFNEGSEWISENNLNLYWTPNRLYDPVLGRFQGLDKLSDMFTSISPMVFSFNNPLKFKDPTGLSGKGDECENCTELPEIIVTATRLSRSGSNNSITLFSYISSNNPIQRNLGLTAKNKGLNAAHDLMNRGQKLHFSEGEYITAKNSDYMDGIKAMVAYGVTGSMIAVAASPILIETLAQSGITGSMVRDLFVLPKMSVQARFMSGGLETLSQLGTDTKFRDLDYFDIATQSVFGFNTFGSILTGSVLDYKPFTRAEGTFYGLSLNQGNRGVTNLGMGAAAGFATDFITNTVKSPGASFVLFLSTDMIMKFNANQINKSNND
nr:RHS repeat-associated core domain-containing protein [Belliella kenyensis]